KNVFRAKKEIRRARVHLRERECESAMLLQCVAHRAQRTWKAARRPNNPLRRHRPSLGWGVYRQACREAVQSSLASIAAFSSPVNASSGCITGRGKVIHLGKANLHGERRYFKMRRSLIS